MSATATVKDELRTLIDEMSVEEAERLLDMVNLYLDKDIPLTPDEEAEIALATREMAAGEFVTLDQLKRDLRV